MYKKPFSFDGRIRRKEFGLSMLIYMLLYFMVLGVSTIGSGSEAILILLAPLIWFILAQGAKRCHDRGNTGFFQLIPFYTIFLLFADGEPGPNEYGPNPKGIGNDPDIEYYFTTESPS